MKKSTRLIGIAALIAMVVFMSMAMKSKKTQPADLVLQHGLLFTVDPDRPWAEACAIKDGRFIVVGADADVQPFIGTGTRVIDLEQRLVVPGFNDSHLHFTSGGFSLLELDLRSAVDEADFAAKIGNHARTLKPGEWIQGGHWDHESWPTKRLPRRELIDELTPANPVFVNRLDGHMALANSLALKMAGITRDTPVPAGGEIVKDPETGQPTGILKDVAMELVDKIIPPPSRQQRQEAIINALHHAASLGLTSVQDNSNQEDFQIYRELLSGGKLSLRISFWPTVNAIAEVPSAATPPDFTSPMLRSGTAKIFTDGSMGSATALFFLPYADDPGNSGLAIFPQSELERLVREIDRRGWQIAAHAIGDKANSWILDAIEKAVAANGQRDSRHRVEHAQVVRAEDVARFRQLGVIASIQPSHCIDDMRWAEKKIGDRIKDAYRFRSFLAAKVRLAFGTDWPVEPLDPMLGLYAAVTRQYPKGGPEGGWFPEEKLTLAEAITCYTMGSAYAEFQEHEKGSLVAGKLADLAVLDGNIFKMEPAQILKTRIDMTILAGRIVFQRRK